MHLSDVVRRPAVAGRAAEVPPPLLVHALTKALALMQRPEPALQPTVDDPAWARALTPIDQYPVVTALVEMGDDRQAAPKDPRRGAAYPIHCTRLPSMGSGTPILDIWDSGRTGMRDRTLK